MLVVSRGAAGWGGTDRVVVLVVLLVVVLELLVVGDRTEGTLVDVVWVVAGAEVVVGVDVVVVVVGAGVVLAGVDVLEVVGAVVGGAAVVVLRGGGGRVVEVVAGLVLEAGLVLVLDAVVTGGWSGRAGALLVGTGTRAWIWGCPRSRHVQEQPRCPQHSAAWAAQPRCWPQPLSPAGSSSSTKATAPCTPSAGTASTRASVRRSQSSRDVLLTDTR